jgi:hypothetical protein
MVLSNCDGQEAGNNHRTRFVHSGPTPPSYFRRVDVFHVQEGAMHQMPTSILKFNVKIVLSECTTTRSAGKSCHRAFLVHQIHTDQKLDSKKENAPELVLQGRTRPYQGLSAPVNARNVRLDTWTGSAIAALNRLRSSEPHKARQQVTALKVQSTNGSPKSLMPSSLTKTVTLYSLKAPTQAC